METRLNPTNPAEASRDLEIQKTRLRDNCREFESVMIAYLMKTMREAVIRAEEPEHAREMYEDMLTTQVSGELARSSAIGLGNMLYTRLEPLLKTRPAGTVPASDAEGARVHGASPDPVLVPADLSTAPPPESIGLKKSCDSADQ